MSKREDQKIAALLRKHAGKVKPPPKDPAAQFDPTLRIRKQPDTPDTEKLFKEMKRREF
jgi:hypothetical protein